MKRNFSILALVLLSTVFIYGQLQAITISPEKSSIETSNDASTSQETGTLDAPPPPPPPPTDDGTLRDPSNVDGDRNAPALPVPEPATIILLGVGLAGYRILRRR